MAELPVCVSLQTDGGGGNRILSKRKNTVCTVSPMRVFYTVFVSCPLTLRQISPFVDEFILLGFFSPRSVMCTYVFERFQKPGAAAAAAA